MAVVWLVLAAILFVFEVRHLRFYALFGAIGCLGASVVAVVFPSILAAQIAVAVVLAAVGVIGVRPYVSRAFEFRHEGHVARGVHGGLVGQEAVTLDQVGDVADVGHVRLLGERWLALSGSGASIPAQTTVVVTAVRGTTLVVWPVDGIAGGSPALGRPESDEAPGGADGRTS